MTQEEIYKVIKSLDHDIKELTKDLDDENMSIKDTIFTSQQIEACIKLKIWLMKQLEVDK